MAGESEGVWEEGVGCLDPFLSSSSELVTAMVDDDDDGSNHGFSPLRAPPSCAHRNPSLLTPEPPSSVRCGCCNRLPMRPKSVMVWGDCETKRIEPRVRSMLRAQG